MAGQEGEWYAEYERVLLAWGERFVGKRKIWSEVLDRARELQETNQPSEGGLLIDSICNRYSHGREQLERIQALCARWRDRFLPWEGERAARWTHLIGLVLHQPDADELRPLVYRAFVMGSVLAARAPMYQPREAKDPPTVPAGVAGDMQFLFPILFCCALYAHVFYPDSRVPHSGGSVDVFDQLTTALVGRRHAYLGVGDFPALLPGMKAREAGTSQLAFYEGFLDTLRKDDDWLSFYMNFPFRMDAQGRVDKGPCTAGYMAHPFAIRSALELERGLMELPFALHAWEAIPAGSHLQVGRHPQPGAYVGEVAYSTVGFLWLKLYTDSSKTQLVRSVHFVLRYSDFLDPLGFVLREWDGKKTFVATPGLQLDVGEGSVNDGPVQAAFLAHQPVRLPEEGPRRVAV